MKQYIISHPAFGIILLLAALLLIATIISHYRAKRLGAMLQQESRDIQDWLDRQPNRNSSHYRG